MNGPITITVEIPGATHAALVALADRSASPVAALAATILDSAIRARTATIAGRPIRAARDRQERLKAQAMALHKKFEKA